MRLDPTFKEYDARGLVAGEYLPEFCSRRLDELESFNDTLPKVTLIRDSRGRQVKSINPDGTSTGISYFTDAVEAFNELGHKTRSEFDAFGRMIVKKEYFTSNNQTNQEARTRYFYSPLGNLEKVIDPKGQETLISYDNLGRKISMTDPDMGYWEYEYDKAGNLICQRDANGRETDFTYDAINRLTQKTLFNNPSTLDVGYTYDDEAVTYSKGRLTKAQYNGDEYTRFTYDAIGREEASEKRINDESYEIKRAYDALNRIKDVLYPDETKAAYAYNNAGEISAVNDGSPVILEDQSRFPYTMYKFNDKEASPFVNDSGTGENNSIASVNTEAFSSGGKIKKSFYFDGTREISIDRLIPHIKDDQKGSFSFWLQVDLDTDIYHTIVLLKNSATKVSSDYLGIFIVNYKIYFQVVKDQYNGVQYAIPFNSNQWHHWAFTQDAGGLKIYRDAVEITPPALTFGVGHTRAWCSFAPGLNSGLIGEWPNFLPNRELQGRMDDFRYYKYGLSFEQVQALYNQGYGTEIRQPDIQKTQTVNPSVQSSSEPLSLDRNRPVNFGWTANHSLEITMSKKKRKNVNRT